MYGVPMIVVPNTIEQAINAARIEKLQAGQYLDPGQLTSAGIRRAADMVLADPAMAIGLRQIRRSFEKAGAVLRAADAINSFKKSYQFT